jgi:hypothetical protein
MTNYSSNDSSLPPLLPPVEPMGAYPQAAPNAAAAPTHRKGLRWWAWLLIVGGALVLALVAGAAYFVFMRATEPMSPNYSGAEVEASDAVGSVVVSSAATVAYNVPTAWVDANDYVDMSSAVAELDEGTSAVGMYLTADPNVSMPQLVMVLEAAPEATGFLPMDMQVQQYFFGLRASGATFEEPVPVAYSTLNGLEGYEANFDASFGELPTFNSVVALGHGDRIVFVQWTSYEGPVDIEARNLFLESLRIDE